jgi:putative aldouronate transport system permease protein
VFAGRDSEYGKDSGARMNTAVNGHKKHFARRKRLRGGGGYFGPRDGHKKHFARRKQGIKLFLMALPMLIAVFVFSYLPLAGWSIAFFDYKLGFSLFDVPFAGFKHFTSLFANAAIRTDFFRVLRNTFGMNLMGIAVSPLPMFFAIALMEVKSGKFRKSVQTLSTIPNFMSWVLVYSLAFSFFAVNGGIVNNLLTLIGLLDKPVNFLASSDNVWLSMTLYGIWKSLGWNAIIYIAAITGIDSELYEAATIDGATRMGRIAYITLPCLLPTFFVLLLLTIASFLSTDFERVYVFSNAINKEFIETLDLFVFNKGFAGRSVPLATAIGMSKSLISLVLLFSANGLSKLVRKESVF